MAWLSWKRLRRWQRLALALPLLVLAIWGCALAFLYAREAWEPSLGVLLFTVFFFESEERASWLREFCIESDRHFGLVDSTVPFFGTGTALELFESNLQENYSHDKKVFVNPDDLNSYTRYRREILPLEDSIAEQKKSIERLQETLDPIASLNRTAENLATKLDLLEKQNSEITDKISVIENRVNQISFQAQPKTALGKIIRYLTRR